jgi:hypothetical protein
MSSMLSMAAGIDFHADVHPGELSAELASDFRRKKCTIIAFDRLTSVPI